MQIKLNEKIRELRRRNDCTQEMLAEAVGVTAQAVSRWESGGSYPDMELIPAIANFFGVTLDELFGYEGDRDKKINAFIEKADSFEIKTKGDGEWLDECIQILREGLAEFPKNERLILALADTLSEAGWRRHKEWLYYDDEGYIQHSYDKHKTNTYWIESSKLCENLINTSTDNAIVSRAAAILVPLCRNFGETEKAISYASRMTELKNSKEFMLAGAADGKIEAKYVGDLLLKLVHKFADQLVYGLITSLHNFESDMPIEKIKGAISLFHLICDDGNFGMENGILVQLYLYLSRLQYERGYHDEAFDSLNKALEHARAYDALQDGCEHSYTAPLVSFVTFKTENKSKISASLPDDWPFWCNPDYSHVEKEIKSDPRWEVWVNKAKSCEM